MRYFIAYSQGSYDQFLNIARHCNGQSNVWQIESETNWKPSETLTNERARAMCQHEAWGQEPSQALLDKARRWYQYYSDKLKDVTEVVLWNGRWIRLAAAAAVVEERGGRCIYLENGLLPKTVQVDIRGVNDRSTLALLPYYPEPDDAVIAKLKRLLPFPQRPPWQGLPDEIVDDSLPENCVLFIAQKHGDSQLTSCDAMFVEPLDAAQATVTAAEQLGMPVALRLHPMDWHRYPLFRERFPAVPIIFRMPVHQCLRQAAVVVMVNSSVGVEARLLDKPVVTMGKSIYHPCVWRWDGTMPLTQMIEQAIALPEQYREGTNRFLTELPHHMVEYTVPALTARINAIGAGLLNDLTPLAERKAGKE